jgi:hypothetical protein
VTDEQLDRLRTRVLALTEKSISVAEVEVEENDGVGGPVVLVTVRPVSADAGAEWDPGDFLAIRRRARDLAVEMPGGQNVRLVYTSDDEGDDPVEDEDDSAADETP